jgi:hypothetical protein
VGEPDVVGPLAWAKRGGALPVWTVRAPTERDHQERGPRHKKLTDGARPRLLVVRRGVPERTLGRVPDRRFAVMTRLGCVRQLPQPLCGSTRLRRDAARYEPAPPRTPRQTGRPRLQGQRRPTWAHVLPDATTGGTTVIMRGWEGEGARAMEITSAMAVWYHPGMPPLPSRWVLGRDPHGACAPQAWLCTDVMVNPVQILEWCVLRWRLEVTWQAARAHVALETQRPWKATAIARTTPALLGRFSMVTLMAGQVAPAHVRPVRQAVGSRNPLPTFAEASATVRQPLWSSSPVSLSPAKADRVEIPCARLNRLTETLCYAA